MVIGALTPDEWDVAFGTAKRPDSGHQSNA